MIKQTTLRKNKNIVGVFKDKISKKILKKKIEDEMYMQYVKNAIQKAEEGIANGEKTYSLEEYRERLRQKYGAQI